MPFQIEEVREVKVIHANARTESHGKEHVRAVDIRMCIEGSNELLDILIQPGLRDFHYFNKAMNDGQMDLPPEAVGLAPKPDLRFPHLPAKYKWAEGKKWRGFRWVRDFGLLEDAFDFTDCAAGNVEYEVKEGGTVAIWFTVSYNGDELTDNALYGELTGLGTVGTIHTKLLAPPELVHAKKGYRAGRPDTPAAAVKDDAQQELESADGEDGGGEGAEEGEAEEVALDPATAEGAFAATVH